MKLPLSLAMGFRQGLKQRCRRPIFAVLVALIMLAALGMLFLALEVVNLPVDKHTFADKIRVSVLETRLQELETELKRNREALAKLSNTMEQMQPIGDRPIVRPPPFGIHQPNLAAPPFPAGVGIDNSSSFSEMAVSSCLAGGGAHTDIQISDLLEKLPFDNVDGGVWKQGWAITYDEAQWSQKNKLKVFVVPHSHNDPGWLKTFEKYYLEHTQYILKNLAAKLGDDPKRTMIWAEISYLDLFWLHASAEERQSVEKLLASGQLEIVTGGWVMNDEAVTHYFSMVEQMIEGHEWLQNHLHYFPTSGWAIDPFGVSPTMAYLLKRMGLQHMVIQRVHYSLKKHLSRHRSLEFHWRQLWDAGNTTDMFCHLMPFYSYDVPHTCGPDPKVCCQFDFKRLPGGKIGCPWKLPPQPITEKNVADRALLLLDQYRKKAQLYRTNVVLVPLGDDFRYDKAIEWDQQYSNYQLLFNHMNKRTEWNVEARFGTLRDYFQAVDAELAASAEPDKSVPSLGGDFFTYADRDDHYWSGFYSSRPLYKNMDRVLSSYLRAAEILYSSLLVRGGRTAAGAERDRVLADKLLRRMVTARRNLALFQHHDAVVGTSRDYVVVDYGNRLLDSVIGMQDVIGSVSAELLTVEGQPHHISFDLDDNRVTHDSLATKTLIHLPPEGSGSRTVVFHNSHGQRRRELVTLLVSSSTPCVSDGEGRETAPAQVDLVWDGANHVAVDRFLLSFVVDVPAFGLSTYSLRAVGSGDPRHAHCYVHSKVELFNVASVPSVSDPWSVTAGRPAEFTLATSRLSATFSPDGLLRSMSTSGDNGTVLSASVSFITYGTTTNGKEKSGAYLFLPGEEPARPLSAEGSPFRVTRGPLLQEARVFIPHLLSVEHAIRLHESPGADGLGLHLHNVVDISRDTANVELAMRLETGVQSGRDFFTDHNAFQIVRRRAHRDKLPLQGNFYPVAAAAFLQDAETRFTLLTAQPLGGTSLQSGWLELVLDRRLNQDDNRGLQQGVLDNKPTNSFFMLLVERRLPNDHPTSHPGGDHLSLAAHLAYRALLYPVLRLIASDDETLIPSASLSLRPSFSAVARDLPCDVHLLNLRTSVAERYGTAADEGDLSLRNNSLLLLHRLGFDCSMPAPSLGGYCRLSDGKINLGELFGDKYRQEVIQTTLTGLYNLETFPLTKPLHLYPMELYAYKLFR